MKITLKQLQKMNACKEGQDWFVEHKISSLRPLVTALLKDDKACYARWLLSRLMTRPQKVRWAIYSAEQVLKAFENKYPKDDRPRKAIKAAKDFLVGKITAHAADAAAYAAHAAAAYAAHAAAYAAADAANAAAYAAAYAADIDAFDVARTKINQKLMNHALKLLGE